MVAIELVAEDEDAILEVLEFTLTRLLTGNEGERAKNAEEELNVVERRASRMSHDGVAGDIENCCNSDNTRDVFPIESGSILLLCR